VFIVIEKEWVSPLFLLLYIKELCTMKKKQAIKLIEAKAIELANKHGVEFFNLDTVTKGGSMIISVRVYSPDGIDHDTCYSIHQDLDQYLDEIDPFEEQYFLEVSSPGLDAKLNNTHTLNLCIGKEVKFNTYVAGETWPKTAVGILTEVNKDNIIVVSGAETYKIDRKMISSIRLHFSF